MAFTYYFLHTQLSSSRVQQRVKASLVLLGSLVPLSSHKPAESRGHGVLSCRGSEMVLEGLSVFVAWFHGGGGCFAFSVVSVWAMRNEWVVMTVGDTEALLTGWFLKTQLV
jgi:hypothetical protein